MQIGTITALHRYPVKSMLGETVGQADITEAGLAGDRAFALLDVESGQIASAKRPQLWRSLLSASARTANRGAVIIELPDGRTIRSDAPEVDATLSRFLGRAVKLTADRPDEAFLERADPEEVASSGEEAAASFSTNPLALAAPAGGFFDFAPVHIVTRSSLAAVAERSGLPAPEALRFRPNLVIDDDGEPFKENGWPGKRLRIGDVELAVIVPTPRCAVPSLEHGALGRVPQLLRAISAANRVEIEGLGPQPCLGAYARVIAPGRIAQGDVVALL